MARHEGPGGCVPWEDYERLRALLWDFVAAPVAGSNEELQAVAVSHQLWSDAADAVGYDEMGQ